MTRLVRMGTRGSPLALAQAQITRQALEALPGGVQVEVVVIHTTGDKDRVRSLVSMGGQGVFVKELEQALLEGSIDIAVHSLKDVPSTMDSRFLLAGFLPRENPFDTLITPNGTSWRELPQGARVGTGSPRRVLQLRQLRPDIQCFDLRGNLDRRCQKVYSGELDAIILGCAGLNRLDWSERMGYVFSPQEMVPAVAQGIVGLQVCQDHPENVDLVASISDPWATLAAQVERGVMVALGGGCRVPLAALLEPLHSQDCRLHLYLGDPQTGKSFRSHYDMSQDQASHGAWKPWLVAVMQECRRLGVPLPTEVSEHALLEFWRHPEKLP